MKKIVPILIILLTLSNPHISLAEGAATVAHSQCNLDHNHQAEVCEIPRYGLLADWDNIPFVWEFRDSPENDEGACWDWGKYYDGLKYTTPIGEYDIDVKNKIAIHCDSEYIYLNIIQATVNYGDRIATTDLLFNIDGIEVRFQALTENGDTLEAIDTSGVHKLKLVHDSGDISGECAEGALAIAYVNETKHNTEIEMRIPHLAFKRQDNSVDLDNINEISFMTTNLMWRPIVMAGISTFPLVLAIAALVLVACQVSRNIKRRKSEKK